MSFEQAIRAFSLWLRAERGLSPHTRRAYVSDVGQLAAFLGDRVPPSRVTQALLRAHLASLHRSLNPASLARKLQALRAFFRFLVREGVVPLDPTAALPSPKTPPLRARGSGRTSGGLAACARDSRGGGCDGATPDAPGAAPV